MSEDLPPTRSSADGGAGFGLHPMAEIREGFRLKDCDALSDPRHRGSLDAVGGPVAGLDLPRSARPRVSPGVERCGATGAGARLRSVWIHWPGRASRLWRLVERWKKSLSTAATDSDGRRRGGSETVCSGA